MNIWIITDTHFGHRKLELPEYGGRPKGFEDIILQGLKQIQDSDMLIHLGDVCMGKDEFAHQELMKELPVTCKKILVCGNHDHKSYNWYYNHGWNFVCQNFTMFFQRKRILFSHRPQPDGKYDINIHGHFHNSDHRSQEPELLAIANPKHKLLAIEHTNYKPVLLEDLIK